MSAFLFILLFVPIAGCFSAICLRSSFLWCLKQNPIMPSGSILSCLPLARYTLAAYGKKAGLMPSGSSLWLLSCFSAIRLLLSPCRYTARLPMWKRQLKKGLSAHIPGKTAKSILFRRTLPTCWVGKSWHSGSTPFIRHWRIKRLYSSCATITDKPALSIIIPV
ncbi:hypothetical protein D9M68_636350 [compost metagenome]